MEETVIIPFYPKFDEREVDPDNMIAQFTAWLDQHGRYGKLYMWDIGPPHRVPSEQSVIRGVRIFEPEIATLFKLLHEV
jgi:hypothetical protein